MNTIDRYVARSLISGYVILLLVGMGLYILTDLLVNLDDFTDDRSLSTMQVIANIVDYYGYNIPLYFSQLGGPLLAIAAAFTLAIMLKNNEMTALVAAGMPLQRLVVPIVACSILIVGLWVANKELVIPKVAHKIARARQDVQGTRTLGVYCVRDERNNILTALRLHPREGLLGGVFIIEPAAGLRGAAETPATGTGVGAARATSRGATRPENLIEADTAAYDPQRKTWRLSGPGGPGRRIVMSPGDGSGGLGASVRYEPVEEFDFGLTPDQLVLRQASEWADMLSLQQMNALVQGGSVANRPSIIMSRHVRLTQPLLQAILLLLALPFFLTREPANVLASGGRALLFAGVFFAVTFATQSIIKEEHAALVAWLPILLFGPLAVVQLANVKT